MACRTLTPLAGVLSAAVAAPPGAVDGTQPDPMLANAVRLEPGTREHRASLDRMRADIDARRAARRNVIVKLARPFSGEEDLFKHMVSFL